MKRRMVAVHRDGTKAESRGREKKNVISIPRTFSVPIGELIESFK